MAAVTRGREAHRSPRWWADDDGPLAVGVARRAGDPAHPVAGTLAVALLLVPAFVVVVRPSVLVAVGVPLALWSVAAIAARREGLGWTSLGLEAFGTLGLAAFTAWLAATVT
jgi:hypothetical protein